MIQIPLALVVAVVIILHTIITHLSNWGLRNTKDDPIGIVIMLFSMIEIVIVISLLCNLKPV
jgi:uncharacterized membrane protein